MLMSASLCLLLLFPSGQTSGDTDQDKEAQQAITKVLDKQVADWNKGDLKSFMEGYHRSEDITFYSGNAVLKGYDAVLERYQKKYQAEGKEMGKVAFRDIDIQLLGADSAVVRGRFELKMSKENASGLFTLVFRKTTVGWRIVHDHTSS